MRPVTDAAQLFSAIEQVRQGASGYTSNFFATPEKARGWVQRGVLSFVPGEESLMIFRRDRDFHHLYHAAADSEALGSALAEVKKWDGFGGALAADLVGHERDLCTIAEVYGAQGFSEYTSLFRMVRLCQPVRHDNFEDRQVGFAEPTDASAILAFMERLLDRFAEQIPTLEDIQADIAGNHIMTVRHGVELGGLLIFETAGLTSTLRYWLVDGRYRDQGIGARLIKTLFHLCRSGKRIVLWVMGDNADAIAKYTHYGFQADGLVDRIMIMKKDA